MRPLEWLALLSFLPIVLLPAVSLDRRRTWLRVAAPLPLAASALQVFVAGWRSQMAPLYVLAAVVVLARLPELLGQPGLRRRRWRGVLASVATALLALAGGALAGWLLPVIALPDPPGRTRSASSIARSWTRPATGG